MQLPSRLAILRVLALISRAVMCWLCFRSVVVLEGSGS